MIGGPLCGGAPVTGIVALSIVVFFLFGWFRAWFLLPVPLFPVVLLVRLFVARAQHSLAVRIFFTSGQCALLLQQRIVVEYLRSVLFLTSADEYPRTFGEILFRRYQDRNRLRS